MSLKKDIERSRFLTGIHKNDLDRVCNSWGVKRYYYSAGLLDGRNTLAWIPC